MGFLISLVMAAYLPVCIREICDLAEKYDAITLVDECHAAGIIGKTGRFVTNCKTQRCPSQSCLLHTTCMSPVCRGTEEYLGMQGRVDIINNTLGKALGGAAGDHSTPSYSMHHEASEGQ